MYDHRLVFGWIVGCMLNCRCIRFHQVPFGMGGCMASSKSSLLDEMLVSLLFMFPGIFLSSAGGGGLPVRGHTAIYCWVS